MTTDEPNSAEGQSQGEQGPQIWSTLRQHWGWALLAGAALLAFIFYITRPTAERAEPTPHKPLVTQTALKPVTEQVTIQALGPVRPVTRVELTSQVSGKIENVHSNFVPGGLIPAGKPIVTVDQTDYNAAVAEAEAALASAREELALERGRHRVALQEWRLSKSQQSTQEKDLATRGPQLRMQKAAVQRAEAELRRARADLERTKLTLAYPALVQDIDAGVGSIAQPSAPIAQIVAVHALWIEASLPVEKLRWLQPGRSNNALIRPQGDGPPVTGSIREIFGDVESKGSLGRALVEIQLGEFHRDGDLRRLPFRLGEMVELELRGRYVEDVFAIPRANFHSDDKVWLITEENELDIRKVEPLFAGPERVLVRKGLNAGERLVTSQLAAPVDGMALRVTETSNGNVQASAAKRTTKTSATGAN